MEVKRVVEEQKIWNKEEEAAKGRSKRVSARTLS